MNSKNDAITIFILCLLFLFIFVNLLDNTIIVANEIGIIKNESINANEYHEPVYIIGNVGFSIENGVRKGNGTLEDPYHISGWRINTSSTSGIIIENTTAHYIIYNCTFFGMEKKNSGIYIFQSENGKIFNVSCEGTKNGIMIVDSIQIDIYNCSLNNNDWGLYLINSCDFSIYNNNIEANEYVGIQLELCSENKIWNNKIENNERDGIFMVGCSNIILLTNEIFQNKQSGLYLSHCIDNSIRENRLYQNIYGMLIFHYSDNNDIYRNAIYDNMYGGLNLLFSNYIEIRNNTICDNGYVGIGLYASNAMKTGCFFNIVKGNNISNNQYYGIYTEYGEGNCFSLNSMNNNNNGGIQAYDEKGENLWYECLSGNYWNDWIFPDENSDGIIDIPYLIDGDSEAADMYPLIKIENKSSNHTPSCKIISPQNGDTVSGELIIEGFAYDLDNDPLIVEIRFDEGNWLEVNGSNSWSFIFNSSLISNGILSVSSRAHDGYHYSIIDMISIFVNNTSTESLKILTNPLSVINQGSKYEVIFEINSIDDSNNIYWAFKTNATFLSFNSIKGCIFGTPDNEDVGIYYINITVTDDIDRLEWINYTLTVLDVNDPPVWSTLPENQIVKQGEKFIDYIEANDIDIGDSLIYSIQSTPCSDIKINETSGKISWVGSLDGMNPNPEYILFVTISVTDGIYSISHDFTICVNPNQSPTSKILFPKNGMKITSEGVNLLWNGSDADDCTIQFYVYFGKNRSDVLLRNNVTLIHNDYNIKTIYTGELEVGKTYYWMVIPKDNFSEGVCMGGISYFIVNIPPSFRVDTISNAIIDEVFILSFIESDVDGDNLKISISHPPVGMKTFSTTIVWIPNVKQIGPFLINITITDGYESSYRILKIIVQEKNKQFDEKNTEKDFSIPISYIIILIFFILTMIISSYYIFKKRLKIIIQNVCGISF